MIKEVSDKIQLDFLREMHIELVGDKLVFVPTGEEFVYDEALSKERSYSDIDSYVFRTKNKLVEFSKFHYRKDIPGRMSLEQNNYVYSIEYKDNYSSFGDERVEFVVRENSDYKWHQMDITPGYGPEFMCTNIYRGDNRSSLFYRIFCCPGYIMVQDYNEGEKKYYPLSFEKYGSIVSEIVHKISDNPTIAKVFLDCVPYFLKYYDKFSMIPIEHEEEFRLRLNERLEKINMEYDEDIKEALKEKSRLLKSIKKGRELVVAKTEEDVIDYIDGIIKEANEKRGKAIEVLKKETIALGIYTRDGRLKRKK